MDVTRVTAYNNEIYQRTEYKRLEQRQVETDDKRSARRGRE